MELSVLQDIFKYAKEKKCPLEKAPHKEKEANFKSVVRKEGTESIPDGHTLMKIPFFFSKWTLSTRYQKVGERASTF